MKKALNNVIKNILKPRHKGSDQERPQIKTEDLLEQIAKGERMLQELQKSHQSLVRK